MLGHNRVCYFLQARCRRQSGFTLLELMVVVAVIGIIISFAGLSLGQHSDERVETEAKRIHQLIKMASDEAVMQSREYSLRFAVEDYMFLSLDAKQGKFLPLQSDKMFRLRQLDPDYRLTLEVEGQEVELVQHAMGKEKPKEEKAEQQAQSKSDTDSSLAQKFAEDSVAEDFEEASLAEKFAPIFDDDKKPVDIYILSSGEVTPFKISLRLAEGDQAEHVIEGTFGGDIVYKPPNALPEEEDGWTF